MLPDHAHKRGHSRAHDLVSSLTRQILLGTFKPGDKLPSENTLVREHGVSRTVVREALSKLQASGLVETRHGSFHRNSRGSILTALAHSSFFI